MHERRPAPEEQVERRSERAGESVRGSDALQLASQMGNVAFTALARSVARQSYEDTIEFPPETITASPEAPSDDVIEFPPETITASPEAAGDDVIEFPPDYIGPTDDDVIEFPPETITAGE